jgi:hypothetical protein
LTDIEVHFGLGRRNSTLSQVNGLQLAGLFNPELRFRAGTAGTTLGGRMKRWAWFVAKLTLAMCALAPTILISASAAAQSTSALVSGDNSQSDSSQGWHDAAPGDRLFFPRDMFWGWAQFDLAPPHNEVDPNQCAGNAAQYGGANAPCNLFARYMLSGILEVRPFGRTQLRRFMVFGAPTFLFGKNVPKTLYTWSPDAIGIEHSWGAGIYITKGFEFRVTQHFLFDRIGARNKNLGLADLGSNGPWGRYMTVGLRKTFGTRRW